MAGITNGQTFIQYDPPVGTFQVGDVWIKTSQPDMVWNILKSKTWQEIKGDSWGNFGTTETPITHVWDGTSWLVTSDFSFVTEMRTSIEQTAEKIESVASRTESINGELKETKTIVTQTADGIKSLATKEELAGTKTSILEQTAESISALVKNDEGMQSQINQQANKISTLVSNDEGMQSQINQQANQISTLVKSDEGMQSQINQQANSIQTLVDNGNGMQSQINQHANQISALVTSDEGMRSQINQQATSIQTLVDNGKDMQSQINQQAGQIDLKANKTDSAGSVQTSTVTINTSGVKIKTGGTFTVDSQKFDINENGEMSATNARISGQLSVNGHDVWHKGNIIVLTTPPSNPTPGTIWVKPDMSSIPAAGTWSHDALPSRPWSNNYVVELNGTSIGAAPSNATYTYEVSVPVYYSHNKTGTCTCTVYLGATSGAKTISMGTQSFTANNAGGNTYTASVTSTTWLGNSGKIYLLVVFSNGNLMTVNSYEAFTCTLMAKSTSATGWKACEVQMYIG